MLGSHWGDRLRVLVGDRYFDATTRTRLELPGQLQFVENRFLWRRALLWQRGVVGPLVRAPVCIVELNPRILSVWAVLVMRRFLNRPTVAWGHAWSRAGPEARTERLRHLMRRLADTVLVYTDTQRRELAGRMPRTRIIAAPNALYRSAQMSASATRTPADIVFVGRLVHDKKPVLLLEAYAEALTRGLSTSHRLIFAGEGPERTALESAFAGFALRAGLVQLRGHISPAEIRSLYESALVSVSPGYVGLSITQSFSFGVPMIIARDEPHSPEIEAAVEEVNSVFVASDDPSALADALISVSSRAQHWHDRRAQIVSDCAARYSVEAMVNGIIEATEAYV
jgi:glycosyltransferase involved in cell wall biosynthesis